MNKVVADIHAIWETIRGSGTFLFRFRFWTYEETWQWIFSVLLKGTFCRFFSVVCLIFSLWFAIKRRNLIASLSFFAVMLCFMYGAQVIHFIGLL